LLHSRFAAFLFPVLLLAQSGVKPGPRKLLVISIGGLDEKFLTQPPTRVKIPNIRKLVRQGAVATGVIGVVPSDSEPSEISLMTGLPPAETAADERKAIPLWQAAARAGLEAGAIFWPATAGAEIAFDFPEPDFPRVAPDARSHDVQFESVARDTTPKGVLDRIETESPGFEKGLWDDESAARATIYLLETASPALLLVHFSDVDSEQRETGALSIYAREILENDDDLIGRMLAKTPPGTVVALVSGHGFENQNYIVRPRVLLGRQSRVEVRDGLIGTPDQAVAARLRELMNDGRRHGIAREVPMVEVRAKAPSLGRWVAAFDTLPNYVASEDDRGPALGPGTHLGVSGLWPTRPGYRGVFAITGAGIQPRNLGEIDLLQIAPTLAGVIGVRFPQAKRRSLWPSISR